MGKKIRILKSKPRSMDWYCGRIGEDFYVDQEYPKGIGLDTDYYVVRIDNKSFGLVRQEDCVTVEER